MGFSFHHETVLAEACPGRLCFAPPANDPNPILGTEDDDLQIVDIQLRDDSDPDIQVVYRSEVESQHHDIEATRSSGQHDTSDVVHA